MINENKHSAEQVAQMVFARLPILINNYIPLPTCPQKAAQANWKRSEAMRLLKQKIKDSV